jgi:abortive infection Abi-like protein
MADLNHMEKRRFEQLFGMGGGYVLNFSNRTFADFIADSVNRDIYAERYGYGGTSKANHLRCFWKDEGNRIAGKLLADMLDYGLAEGVFQKDHPALEECRRTIARMMQDSPVPELDALSAISDEKDFEVVAKAVRDAIERNEPEAGLDRLHTFVIKYVRSLCTQHGLVVTRDKPLHSLFGELVKRLREAGHIESEMTSRILKSSISILEAFNDVRNNQSLAHDNAILGYEEALVIFNHVASSIRFVESIHRAALATQKTATANDDDEIPF